VAERPPRVKDGSPRTGFERRQPSAGLQRREDRGGRGKRGCRRKPEAVVLRHYLDIPEVEIAAVLGTTTKTVRLQTRQGPGTSGRPTREGAPKDVSAQPAAAPSVRYQDPAESERRRGTSHRAGSPRYGRQHGTSDSGGHHRAGHEPTAATSRRRGFAPSQRPIVAGPSRSTLTTGSSSTWVGAPAPVDRTGHQRSRHPGQAENQRLSPAGTASPCSEHPGRALGLPVLTAADALRVGAAALCAYGRGVRPSRRPKPNSEVVIRDARGHRSVDDLAVDVEDLASPSRRAPRSPHGSATAAYGRPMLRQAATGFQGVAPQTHRCSPGLPPSLPAAERTVPRVRPIGNRCWWGSCD
jgi:hypothetical protein